MEAPRYVQTVPNQRQIPETPESICIGAQSGSGASGVLPVDPVDPVEYLDTCVIWQWESDRLCYVGQTTKPDSRLRPRCLETVNEDEGNRPPDGVWEVGGTQIFGYISINRTSLPTNQHIFTDPELTENKNNQLPSSYAIRACITRLVIVPARTNLALWTVFRLEACITASGSLACLRDFGTMRTVAPTAMVPHQLG